MSHPTPHPHEQTLRIVLGPIALTGDIAIPDDPVGTVIFAHGSGSSRLSSRNRYVAGVLHRAGLATLLFDLLTPQEEHEEQYTRHLRFDIGLLSRRLFGVTLWLHNQDLPLRSLKTGYFGASTGAAAAIVAATQTGSRISAVVSRGGRPDLAGDALLHLTAPTLLIVGSLDEQVITLNRQAMAAMAPGTAELQIVPGATHLFEEPGTLEKAAGLARDWFMEHLPAEAA